MNPFPPAALAALAAGLDEYRLITPPEQYTPDAAARYAAAELVASGWAVHIQPQPTGLRRPCPVCTHPQRVNQDGRIRRHGDADRPCPGSGSPHRAEAAA